MLELGHGQPERVADLPEQRLSALEPGLGLLVLTGCGCHAGPETCQIAAKEPRDLGGGGGLRGQKEPFGIVHPSQLQCALDGNGQCQRYGLEAERLPCKQRLLRLCQALLEPPLTPTEQGGHHVIPQSILQIGGIRYARRRVQDRLHLVELSPVEEYGCGRQMKGDLNR